MKEQVVSPLKGELIEIARVSDPMFSKRKGIVFSSKWRDHNDI